MAGAGRRGGIFELSMAFGGTSGAAKAVSRHTGDCKVPGPRLTNRASGSSWIIGRASDAARLSRLRAVQHGPTGETVRLPRRYSARTANTRAQAARL
jgi:hypothetical protein